MKRLRKFLHLTSAERCLLINTALLLGAIRLGLWLLPLHTLRRLLARVSQPTAKLQEADQAFVDKVVWAVTVASHYVPGARCLAQALATQVLLERRGYPNQLRIGVARSKGGQMSAHAWVESQGQVVIGGSGNMALYIPVPLQEVESDANGRWYLFS
ncbi:MAG TPA: lasso peptide biosynthesis B2 protein [Cyanobacteria bacterium UBA11369]|nr:lasso peptide biosynthesis B2 protein [Cyanobacteria bacterium UBA11371]HBE35639.1 lasso peptide biosynthesis B2 protein [Cyanobacteria bacterium UBA11368]HBE48975.1 lasso peptide biosynthesis B2 protein [Cyanobacteria bacterium UBA11369]